MTNAFYSIKTKYTIYLVAGVLAASLLVGGSSAFLMHRNLVAQTANGMNLNCHEEANAINDVLDSTEQSVKFMQQYAQRLRPDLNGLLTDKAVREEYEWNLAQMFEAVAVETSGNMSYYFRLNPDYFPSDEGFLYSREYGHETLSDGYVSMELTDLAEFSPDDEAVGWFYIPVRQGYGAWISPYWGENLQMNMISYVEPVYVSGKIIGVIGMDVDFDHVLARVGKEKMHDDGYAFLIGNNDEVISSNYVDEKAGRSIGKDEVSQFADSLRKFSSGEELIPYRYNGVDKRMVYYTLNNAMKLVEVADANEIFAELNLMIALNMLFSLFVAVVLALIGYQFAKRLTRPLKKLSEAAIQAGTGDLSVEIPEQERRDEVGNLARAFQNTTSHLQQYVDYVQHLAYKDALTDVQNKAAYDMSMEQMDVDIRMGRARFALIMIDLNRLKKINDTYGHEIGNRYIINLCAKITDIFAVETVYRIGGDEFIVLIKGDDYEQRDELLQRLRRHLDVKPGKAENPWDNVSAATGMSEFDPANDGGTDEVFKRADEAMYQNKLAMKAARE